MERRSFLALLASAPIAALAPWPHFLPKKMSEMSRYDWFADQNISRFNSETGWVDVPYRYIFNTKTGTARYEFLD